jgi:hypothetical protein
MATAAFNPVVQLIDVYIYTVMKYLQLIIAAQTFLTNF